MFNSKLTSILFASIALSGALFASSSQAAGLNNTVAVYGTSAAAGFAERDITLTAGTKSVNVTNGETVRFLIDGASFTWNFSTLRSETSFDLSSIAPDGVKVAARVYVASNPLYRN